MIAMHLWRMPWTLQRHSQVTPSHVCCRRILQALANAEAERLAAEKAHQQAQTLGSRISGWFAGRQPTAVVASSDATGAAAAQDVRDPSRAKGTEKGERHLWSGYRRKSSVAMRDMRPCAYSQ